MTLVTGSVQDLGMTPLDGKLTARPARFRTDGTVVYSTQPAEHIIEAGVVNVDLAPGPAVIEILTGVLGKTVLEVVIPDTAEVLLSALVDESFPWTPAQVSEFARLRDETVAAAQTAQDLLDGYVGGGEGTTNAALINGVFTDRVDVSQARVTTDATDRSVSELADEVDTKADQYHGHPMASVGGLVEALDGKASVDHSHSWGSVVGKPDVFPPSSHTHPVGEVDGLDTVLGSVTDALTGKADLDGAGRLPASQLPALAIVEFLGEVDGEAAMLTLEGERGDWCVRQDTGTQWVVIAEPSNVAGSWREMVAPPSPVQSVAGRIGAVVLSRADVGLGSVDNTSDADKPVSTATQQALNGKADTGHTHTAAEVGAVASDGTITKAVRITQAEYDALPVKDPTTMYVIGGTA